MNLDANFIWSKTFDQRESKLCNSMKMYTSPGQNLHKKGKLDPCISLQLCLASGFKNWLLSTLFIESTQRQCIFIYQLYLHQKIKLTSLQLRTLRKTQPGNKQIVFERWFACPLNPLHPSLAEKERYHRMKSVFKHFHSVTLKESQSSVSYMTF